VYLQHYEKCSFRPFAARCDSVRCQTETAVRALPRKPVGRRPSEDKLTLSASFFLYFLESPTAAPCTQHVLGMCTLWVQQLCLHCQLACDRWTSVLCRRRMFSSEKTTSPDLPPDRCSIVRLCKILKNIHHTKPVGTPLHWCTEFRPLWVNENEWLVKAARDAVLSAN